MKIFLFLAAIFLIKSVSIAQPTEDGKLEVIAVDQEEVAIKAVNTYTPASLGIHPIGLYGESAGATGYGIYGKATGSFALGIFGEATGNDGIAIYGSATGFFGVGVRGNAAGEHGRGVFGDSGGTHGQGVSGSASGSRGRAVSGTATGSSGIGVYGEAVGSSSKGIGIFGFSKDSTGIYGDAGNSSQCDFFANTTDGSTAYGQASSIRWKSEIRNIDEPLRKLAELRGVYFQWNHSAGSERDLGFIAEEVGKVLPEIVIYEDNGIDALGMDYSKVTPLLVEAANAMRDEYRLIIEKHQEQINQLSAEVENLRFLLQKQLSAEN